ncbi:DMT family transporter [uncultured Roseovarius sp.]|uniref:DMT family transporter n=1 Tax=uncultured Roseovarius sp. TaxID=293344 RepID=UPI00262A51A9|nr:DMT family transporter [uncultured Roseovarius sp.]
MKQVETPSIDLTSGALLLGLATVWGGSFFFAEIALREVPPLTITLHRVFWAVPALLLVVWWKGIKIPTSASAWACYLVMGALNNAIPFSLIFWGQTTIGSGLASILNGTTAVFGAVVAGILLVDEPLTARKIIGALFGVLGVAVIMGLEALTNFDPRNLGQLAILGAALSYSFAGVWGKRFLSGYPPIMNACGMLIGSTILMLPVAFVVDGAPSFNLSPEIWASLFAVAILSTAVAYLLYFEILVRAGSANLMLVTLLIPPIAVGLGYAFLDERLGSEAVYGFGLIALGLMITDGRLLNRVLGRRGVSRK